MPQFSSLLTISLSLGPRGTSSWEINQLQFHQHQLNIYSCSFQKNLLLVFFFFLCLLLLNSHKFMYLVVADLGHVQTGDRHTRIDQLQHDPSKS